MARLQTAFVLGCHGCSAAVGEAILGGARMDGSDREYDWLGPGMYFWESDPVTAQEQAYWKVQRGEFTDPFVVGAAYGSDSVETTVYESVYHWYKGLLCHAGYERQVVMIERKVQQVACAAALLDFRAASTKHSDLLHPADYSFCQSVGARIHREGRPGLLTPSVRRPAGENVVIFNPDVLSNPRLNCQLTYRLEGDQIVIEKQPGVAWITLAVASFSQRKARSTCPWPHGL